VSFDVSVRGVRWPTSNHGDLVSRGSTGERYVLASPRRALLRKRRSSSSSSGAVGRSAGCFAIALRRTAAASRLEWEAAAERFEHHHSDGVDVSTTVIAFVAESFWGLREAIRSILP
jgi:hypothetical protein